MVGNGMPMVHADHHHEMHSPHALALIDSFARDRNFHKIMKYF
jgi:hypothetical protein